VVGPGRRFEPAGPGRIAIASPDLLGNIGASRGLQIPSRRYHSPYWKPRHVRGLLLLIAGVIRGLLPADLKLWPELAHKLPPNRSRS
jgi:hypothetical protein